MSAEAGGITRYRTAMEQRRTLEFISGVPNAIVPDNLKSAVTKASRYEPDLNPAYLEFAECLRRSDFAGACENRETKPKRKSACKSSNGGSSRDYATRHFSRWPNSTP